MTDTFSLFSGLLARCCGLVTDEVARISTGSASKREYYRIRCGAQTFIGCHNADLRENRTFLSLSRLMEQRGINVAKVIAVSDDESLYVLEDLGDESLLPIILSEEDPRRDGLIRAAIDQLVAFQQLPEQEWSGMLFEKPMCRMQMMWDLNYFKYCFLRQMLPHYDEYALESEFSHLADQLEGIPSKYRGLMYRDFQSRNVMVHDGKPYLIDFQGARSGILLYDIVSFLWQARARFSAEDRHKFLLYYIGGFGGMTEEERREFASPLPHVVVLRMMQVLGAYGFRGLIERKAQFVGSIPAALTNLKEALESAECYPYLLNIINELSADSRLAAAEDREGLTVQVYSFSYKQGSYPADLSGNGGGFMFDCRAMHNPGRYQQYRQLTGRDSAVADFLEQKGEVQPFLANAWGLTDPAVERYLKRGFSHLQIGFGCTGGQHRSVYCAEQTARHIRERFPEVNVELIHREQCRQ